MLIKSTLDETSDFGPSAAVVDGRHYVAWIGLDDRLNALQLGGPKLTLDTTGFGGIALAGRPGTGHDLAIAWTDSRTGMIFVAPGFRNPLSLDLQFGMSTRVTSFTDGLGHLNIASSDDGLHWANKVTLPTSTCLGPTFHTS